MNTLSFIDVFSASNIDMDLRRVIPMSGSRHLPLFFDVEEIYLYGSLL